MRSKASLITARLIMFYLLSVVGRSAAEIEESPSSSLHSLSNDLGYKGPSEKKAYGYVSEYKRLPLYNFGIGKRWIDNNEDKRTRPFSFGIGKRYMDYRFGIGKRDNGYHPLGLDYFSSGDVEGYRSRVNDDDDSADGFMEDKRGNQPFSFGIGKRAWKLKTGSESAATGRRPNDAASLKYLLSLGKGTGEDGDLLQ